LREICKRLQMPNILPFNYTLYRVMRCF
jgi:hypothetical protein